MHAYPVSNLPKPQPRGGIVALIACLLIATNTFALGTVDTIPAYSISPDLSGLNISYFAKQDKIKITLYAINHEKIAVTCDTRYESGPDTKHGLEQTIQPEKAVAFSYDYSKDPHSITLQLKCILPGREKPAEAPQVPAVKYYDDANTPDSH
jgi:hypothetical protein